MTQKQMVEFILANSPDITRVSRKWLKNRLTAEDDLVRGEKTMLNNMYERCKANLEAAKIEKEKLAKKVTKDQKEQERKADAASKASKGTVQGRVSKRS